MGMIALDRLRSDVRTLDAFPVLSRHGVPEVCEDVGRALAPHHFTVAGQPSAIAATLGRASVGGLSMMLLRYGADAQIVPEPMSDLVLLQIVLSGEVEIRDGTQCLHAGAGNGLILESLDRLTLDWSSDCEQLIVPIPRAALVRAAETMAQDTFRQPFGFDRSFALDSAAGRALAGLLSYMVATADAGCAMRDALEAPVLNLLTHHLLRHHSTAFVAGRQTGSAIAPYYVRRAELFMARHVGEAVSLPMLAAHAQVSVRTLTAGFRQHRGTTPLAALRDRRLAHVRAELQRNGANSVTEVALRYGFNHLGRFAAAYRKQFGENPSATAIHGSAR